MRKVHKEFKESLVPLVQQVHREQLVLKVLQDPQVLVELFMEM